MLREDLMSKEDNNGTPKADNASDVAFVKALAEVLRDNDLGELEVERGTKQGAKLSVRISKAGPVAMAAAPMMAAPVAAPVAASAPVASASVAHNDPVDLPGAIPSPMVGTVYLSPEPGADAFVKVGSMVSEGDTLMIIEAMKTMNHIHAPRAGTVKRIMVEDGGAVEYGAPLMVVE